MNLSRPDRSVRLDALAASYALGTLAGRSRRRLDRIAQTDPTVAAAVRGWEEIRKRLGLSGEIDSNRTQAAPWWASLSLWRGLALAGFALAFALGLLLL